MFSVIVCCCLYALFVQNLLINEAQPHIYNFNVAEELADGPRGNRLHAEQKSVTA
jgi:hypothetical protein